MKEFIEKFIRYLDLEKGASAHTLRAYRKDLNEFAESMGGESHDIDLIDIRGFVAGQIRKGLNKTTVSRRLSSIRSFFKFLYREGYRKTNPAKLVPNPKAPKPLPRFLSVDDAFSLVEKPQGIGFLDIRNRAILELLYSSGLRVSELSGIDTEDMSMKEALIKSRGKGRKERIVPIGSKALDAIKSYLVERMLMKSGEKALFLNRTGKRLTERGIRRIVVKYARAIALHGRIGPHTLRHSFASHLLRAGEARRRLGQQARPTRVGSGDHP